MFKKIMALRKKIKKRIESRFGKFGFTLMELLVVLAILSTLTLASIITLNPFTQLSKAQNAQMQQDLQQVKSALDLYYNDHGCYPEQGSFIFGGELKSGDTVYMKKIPKSPISTQYVYEVSGSCPQWNILFAKLNKIISNPNISSCPLAKTNCAPSDYTSEDACVISGNIDCAYISSINVFPSPTPTPLPTSTPTPTPTPIPPAPVTLYISFNQGVNPNISLGTIDPQYPEVGVTQTISVSASDPSAIQSVSVRVSTDTNQTTIPLKLTSGTATNGTWTNSWTFYNDTYNNNYCFKITAVDALGSTTSTEPCFK